MADDHPLAPPDLPAPPETFYRVDHAAYHEMGRVGLIRRPGRVVLLDGFLVTKMPKSPRHVRVVRNVHDELVRLSPDGFHVRKGDPVAFHGGPDGTDSEPDPDVVLVRGSKADYDARHPGPADIVLAVEVAANSLEVDRKGLARHAWFEVPCVWLVDLRNSTVEIFTSPVRDPDNPRYAESRIAWESDEIEVTADGLLLGRIAVNELLA